MCDRDKCLRLLEERPAGLHWEVGEGSVEDVGLCVGVSLLHVGIHKVTYKAWRM